MQIAKTTRQELEAAGNAAVRMLRERKLKSGLPFMINTSELPADQCYLEYPNNIIEHVKLSDDKMDFIVLKKLTAKQVKALQSKFKLGNI